IKSINSIKKFSKMKEIKIGDFKVSEKIKLSDTNTAIDLDSSKDELKEHLKDTRKKLGKLQDKLYAHGKYAVLVCLQGIDTAGKDSLIREVFKDFNVRGVVVTVLKHQLRWKSATTIYGVII